MAKIGRNEPCPCGSGKKYKKCCLKGPTEVTFTPDVEERALDKAVEWLSERYPEDLEAAVEQEFTQYLPDSQFQAFVDLPADILQLASINAYEWALAEGWTRPENGSIPLMDLVLGIGGPIMEVEQRQFLSKFKHAALNLYEVTDAELGQRIQLRELVATDPSGEPKTQWVSAPMLSRGELSTPGTVIGLRVIPGNPPRLTDATYYFPGSWTAGVLTKLRENVKEYPQPEDFQFAFSAPIISEWLSILTAKPPTLVDQASGDPILMVTDHYRIVDEDSLRQRLEPEADVDYDPENGWVRLQERDDGTLSPMSSLNKGEKPGSLEVFSRTQAYADDSKAWLENIAGDALAYITREISDPMSLADAAGPAEEESAADLASEFSPEEIGEIVGKHYRDIYSNWADDPIPALDNMTPREAMEDPEDRQQVIDLLDSYDRNELKMAAEQGRKPHSFDFLRLEIGLSPRSS